ncbi:MAG: hypothetical protein HQL50_13800 [Magnetococcales bacterium]|nr:hypothetical protein [Magnetococcales bacterium]
MLKRLLAGVLSVGLLFPVIAWAGENEERVFSAFKMICLDAGDHVQTMSDNLFRTGHTIVQSPIVEKSMGAGEGLVWNDLRSPVGYYIKIDRNHVCTLGSQEVDGQELEALFVFRTKNRQIGNWVYGDNLERTYATTLENPTTKETRKTVVIVTMPVKEGVNGIFISAMPIEMARSIGKDIKGGDWR